jgi:2'-5' RNA ligase
MKNLILLNIYDKELEYFIDKFCILHHIKKPSLVPHVTIQGPFIKEKRKSFSSTKIATKLNTYIRTINRKGNSIHINGVGMFQNDEIYIIYLKVYPDEELKMITNKTDYPIQKYGFNPHITIATTKNRDEAIYIKKELENNNINFNCYNVDWNTHKIRGDKNLFNI